MSRKACLALSIVILIVTAAYAILALGLWETLTPQLSWLFADTDLLWRIAILVVLLWLDYRLIRGLIMPKEENLDLLRKQGRALRNSAEALDVPCRITISRSLDYEGSRGPVNVYCNGEAAGKLARGGQLTVESSCPQTQIAVRFPGLDARAAARVLTCESGGSIQLVFSLRDGTLLPSGVYGE